MELGGEEKKGYGYTSLPLSLTHSTHTDFPADNNKFGLF